MDEWKEGDVVQLKSSGPMMTVVEIQSDGNVACVWFAGDDKLLRNVFNPKALTSDKMGV